MYLAHLYRPDIAIAAVIARADIPLGQVFVKTCKVYVLAAMLMDEPTKNNFRHEMARLTAPNVLPGANAGPSLIPTTEAIVSIYTGTVDGDPARNLLVNLFTEHGNATNGAALIAEPADNLPQAFLKDLMASLLANRRPSKEV